MIARSVTERPSRALTVADQIFYCSGLMIDLFTLFQLTRKDPAFVRQPEEVVCFDRLLISFRQRLPLFLPGDMNVRISKVVRFSISGTENLSGRNCSFRSEKKDLDFAVRKKILALPDRQDSILDFALVGDKCLAMNPLLNFTASREDLLKHILMGDPV